jgi:hypothetical protein
MKLVFEKNYKSNGNEWTKKVNMNRGKIGRLGEVVTRTLEVNLEDGATLALAALVGINQGLKYNGSLVRGVKSAVAVLATMVVVSTVYNVFKNRKYILANATVSKKRYS